LYLLHPVLHKFALEHILYYNLHCDLTYSLTAIHQEGCVAQAAQLMDNENNFRHLMITT